MEKVTIKDLTNEEFLSFGSLACPGCAALLTLRYALKVLGRDTIVINPTGCLAVIMQMGVPKVPYFHPLFENGPAVISGIDTALEVMGKREGVNLLCIAGDGATADIGLASLSGAVERNHNFMYICYDNESYMNTGGQRSGTTPFGARTTTTPVGSIVKGEDRPMELKKDVAEMMIAQGCPYVATASIAYPIDYMRKVKKASEIRGPSYIHVHSSCVPGWGIDSKDAMKACRLAVQTGFVILYEHEKGKRTFQHLPRKREPVVEYLKLQERFGHLLENEAELSRIQAFVDERFKKLGLE